VLASLVTNREQDRGKPTVVLLGTLDTKGAEYAYLRDRVTEAGVDVVVVDAGILGDPLFVPDITREQVALAAGADIRALAERRDRGAAIEAMSRGAAVIAAGLRSDGRLDGIAGLGGTGGSAIVAAAMATLPVGVPKLLASTVASGDTRAYVGASDVMMMYSVADFSGLNRISAQILTNAGAAVAAMASATTPPLGEPRPTVCASMFGVTTPCVTTARQRLEDLGYEVLVFHQTGIGGQSMEELMKAGFIDASLDVTTTELADELVGGVWPAAPDRLEVAARLGIPQVVSLGALDFVCVGPLQSVPAKFDGRTFYEHSPAMAGMRTTAEECTELGRRIAGKLSVGEGPTALFVPLRGVSLMSVEGQEFYDLIADDALFASLREHLDHSRVELHELDADINDPAFALAMADRLHELRTAWIQV
jgi:uncharacterized protein (UPF0261 family)